MVSVITRAGAANADGSPKDVSREFATMFTMFDENGSPVLYVLRVSAVHVPYVPAVDTYTAGFLCGFRAFLGATHLLRFHHERASGRIAVLGVDGGNHRLDVAPHVEVTDHLYPLRSAERD